jgi:CDP-glucose 4,6-dehydratase
MPLDAAFWRGKRVLLTGHTGFKGGWTSIWLRRLGAEVTGYALAPDTQPSLFGAARVGDLVHSEFGDICDQDALRAVVSASTPEIVIHMAAQPLVRVGYEEPLRTYATNVGGTANVIDAARGCDSVKAVVVISSDKCYDLRGQDTAHAETDPLGGAEPYSASKAGAEFVVEGMRPLAAGAHRAEGMGLATARAGNAIGGGDWSRDRLIPDLVTSFEAKRPTAIRNPEAVRPWQHVLDAVHGYFLLMQRVCADPGRFGGAWNFGPSDVNAVPVRTIADRVCALLGAGASWQHDSASNPVEAHALRLDSNKASSELGWRSRLRIEDALAWTVEWFKRFDSGADARTLVEADIERYERIGAA